MNNEKVKIDKNIKFPEEIVKGSDKVVHFVGLGGIGMSGLAKFLLELGYKVSGSDIKDGPTMFSVSGHGGTVLVGHTAKNIQNASLIVVSSAIKESNPEIIEARKRNLPIMHRSQLLEAIMSGLGNPKGTKQKTIGVSGTHGKTTTTGMISLVFEDAKLNPSIVVGGQMPYLNTNSKLGNDDYFIAELDESDGTIEFYKPDISVITNLELDHPDHYVGGFDQLLNTFKNYIYNLHKESKIIINADCEGNKKLLELINHPGIILYSCNSDQIMYKNTAYTVKNILSKGLNSFAEVYKNKEYLGKIKLGVPGIHNISNALATIAVAIECGIDFSSIADSLARFTGMKRRFQILGSACGAKIVDDYAHHPTEVQATLKAAKEVINSADKGRVVAIFQPHRYTRLQNFWNEFVNSFNNADLVYVCDVYSAGDKPIDNINSERLSKEIKNANVTYVPGPIERVADVICPNIKPDDLVLTIGAGDITKLGHIIIEKMGLDRVLA